MGGKGQGDRVLMTRAYGISLPDKLPHVEVVVYISPYPLRPYQGVCYLNSWHEDLYQARDLGHERMEVSVPLPSAAIYVSGGGALWQTHP